MTAGIFRSAITEAIKTLERETGTQLFIRHAKGVTLTHEGHQFLRHAHRILSTVAGGKAASGSGFFFEPMVIAGARQEDEIVRREVFGPVVPVTHFMLANEMPHGGMNMKMSGYDKDMSMYGLEDYTVVRHVMLKQ